MAENQTEVPETETIDMKEELTKLEDEINTLKQVLDAKIGSKLWFLPFLDANYWYVSMH